MSIHRLMRFDTDESAEAGRTRRSNLCFDKIVAHDKNLWVKCGEEEEEGEKEEEMELEDDEVELEEDEGVEKERCFARSA